MFGKVFRRATREAHWCAFGRQDRDGDVAMGGVGKARLPKVSKTIAKSRKKAEKRAIAKAARIAAAAGLDGDGDVAMGGGGIVGGGGRSRIIPRFKGTGKDKSGTKLRNKIGKSKGKLAKLAKGTAAVDPAVAVLVETIMGERWNSATQTLNLRQMMKDPRLLPYVKSDVNQLWSAGVAPVLVKVVKAKCPTIVTLDLGLNGFRSLQCMKGLANAAPKLTNLSFEGNDVKNLGELGHIKALTAVRNLVLAGNPGLKKFPKTAAGRCNYERQIRKFFPELRQLDGAAVSSSVPLAPKEHHLPEQFRGIIGSFVAKYFAALSEPGRPNLPFAFGPTSMFSLTVLTGGSKLSRVYVEMNRNLQRAKGGKELKGLFIGQEAIVNALRRLPAARYDPAAVKVDVWLVRPARPPLAAVLGVNLRGTFQDQDKKLGTATRTFQRTLLLSQTTPSSPAFQAGWPLVIANEQLHVGECSKLGELASKGMKASSKKAGSSAPHSAKPLGASVAAAAAAAVSAAAPVPTALQQFIAKTRLQPQIAKQCLDSNGGNLDKAWNDFLALKAKGRLLPSYFVPG